MSVAKPLMLGALAAATMLTAGCADEYGPRPSDSYYSYRQYDYNRPDPRYGHYYADQYYVDNSRYRERRLGRDDRIYRGRDGRYYCRRSDGTTGLIVGGIAGGVLGGAIVGGDSAPLGVILGAIAGGVAGQAVDKNNSRDVRCR
jgi:hypothetical protein